MSAPDTARRSSRKSSILLVAALVVGVALTVWSAAGAGNDRPLDPANAGPDGTRALARVLDGRGLDVEVVRGRDELDAARVDSGTTVLVTSTDALGTSTLRHLRLHAREGEVVLVDPGILVLEALGVAEQPDRRQMADPFPGRCEDPRFDRLRVEADRVSVFPGEGCFTVGNGALLVSPADGLWLFGAADALTNEQILGADNAAVALRLAGSRERVVWYVPAATDLTGEDTLSVSALLPRWLAPALWLLALATLAAIAWRIRRLGPLAVEPLPVTVRAIETTTSRGRLYRKAGDREHASRSLRAASRRRLARTLRPADGDDRALVDAVAAHTGRSPDRVGALLTGDPPSTDDHLITLARDLAALEEEVRRR